MAFQPSSGGGSGTSLISSNITQTAHGFVVGNWIYYTGTAYAKAIANGTTAQAKTLGIVTSVTDANTFKFTSAGLVSGLTGLTAGSQYWLSSTAGAMTTTTPQSSYSRPIFIATSTTEGYVNQAGDAGVQSTSLSGTQLLTDGSTFSTTLVDIAGSTFTLPVAGTYDVEYIVNGTSTLPNLGTVALYTSADVLVPNTVSRQALFSDGIQFQNRTQITITSATTYKLKGITNAQTVTVLSSATHTSSTGSSKIVWNQIGAGAVPMSLAGEYGINNSIIDTTNATGTFADVTNGFITIPSAGTWVIRYSGAVTNANATGATLTRVVDNTNIVVAGTYSSFQSSNAGDRGNTNGQAIVITSGSAVYKLQMATAGGGTSTIYNSTGNNGQTSISFQKVSGFLPTSGTTVDYVSVSSTALSAVLTVNSAVLFNTINSGNIPYNTGTGLFTLTAGKTYRLLCGARIQGASQADLSWMTSANVELAVAHKGGNANVAGDFQVTEVIYTPTVNIDVKVAATGVGTSPQLAANLHWANIVQVGSSATTTNTPFYAAVERHNADYSGASLFSFASGTSSAWDTVGAVGRRLQFTAADGTSNNITIGTNVFTINTTGVYRVTVSVAGEIANANSWYGQLVNNSASVLAVATAYNNASGSNGSLMLSYLGTFTAGDIVDVRLGGITAGNVSVDAFSFNVEKLNNF